MIKRRIASHIPQDQGFTLLELLMVVTILSTVAWMSLSVVTNNTDQVRFEDTRNRLDAIRHAIIGDSSRTLNGHPEIRGYVADMGSLPPNLNALLRREYCSDPRYTTESDCTGVSETWNEQPVSTFENTYGFRMGWNGPYLQSAEMTGYPRFQDGWGNTDLSSHDFGWQYSVDSGSGDLTVQSLGRDGASGGGDDYEDDYPPDGNVLVPHNAYRLTVTDAGEGAVVGDGTGGIAVDFGETMKCWVCSDGVSTTRLECTGALQTWAPVYHAESQSDCSATGGGVWLPSNVSNEKLCLKVAVKEKGIIKGLVSVDSTINSMADHSFVWDGSRQRILFMFADGTALTMGKAAFKVVEYDDALNACTDTAFPADHDTWQNFTVVPGSVMNPLEWDVM